MGVEFIYRSTILKPVAIQGKGLHTGREISFKLIPASVNTGIIIKNIETGVNIPVHISNIQSTKLATTVGTGTTQVHTIEHFMAACSAWGIDDLIIEVDGPEFPIMDGSSSAFVFLLERAGRKVFTGHAREYLRIKKEIILQLGKSYLELAPSMKDQLNITSSIEFNHPKIKNQKFSYTHSQENFLNELCSARTFCFEKDIEAMKTQGLIKGGSLQSAIVLNDVDVLNPDGLRFPNEFVRHKLLDTIGDLYVAGYPIIGNFKLHCSGHEVNRLAVKAILDDHNAYEIVTFDNNKQMVPDAAIA